MDSKYMDRTKRLAVWCATLALSLVAAPDLLDAQESAAGSRPIGMGDAYTSIATGPSGIYHNPAGVPMAPLYAVGANYEYRGSYSIINPAAVDSVTNRKITAGLGYSYLLSHGGNDAPSGHDIRAAIAVPALERRFAVGVGGRYVVFKRNQTEFARGFTMDGGVIVRFSEDFHAGVAGKNLIEVCRQLGRCRGVTPRTVAGGLAYGRSTAFQFAGELEVDFNSEADDINFAYQAGGEYMIAGSVPVRLGYRHATLDTSNHVTAGVGYRSKRAGFDAGVDVNLDDLPSVLVSASLVIYFTPTQRGTSARLGPLE